MKKLIAILAFVSFCMSVRAQYITDSLLIDGHQRYFHFNKPTQIHSGLLFALHGSGGTGEQMHKMAGKLETIEQSENLILVYPDAYQRVWNECRKMANTISNIENIDENTFFSQLIMYFKSKYQIDDKKIYAIGFSGGGQMAFKLAMTMPAQFKGITVISANLPDVDNLDCPELKKPISVMIVNGTADPVCPYGGGEMTATGYVFGKVRSAELSFHYWSEIDGYLGDPSKQVLPDPDTTDNIRIEKYAYQHKGQPDVVLLKVINGQHEFPKDIDIFLEAWTFFKGK